MSKLFALVIGVALGAALLALVLGIAASALVVGVLGLTLLVRRDWVPVVYNTRSLTVRKVTTTVTALGLGLVVFVFASVLVVATGIRETLANTGDAQNVK